MSSPSLHTKHVPNVTKFNTHLHTDCSFLIMQNEQAFKSLSLQSPLLKLSQASVYEEKHVD